MQEVMGKMIYQAGVDYEYVLFRIAPQACANLGICARTRPM